MNYKDDLYKSRSEMDHAPKKKKNSSSTKKWPKKSMHSRVSMLGRIDERRITQKAKFEVRFFSGMTTQEMEDYLKPLFKKVTRLHLSVYIKKSIR